MSIQLKQTKSARKPRGRFKVFVFLFIFVLPAIIVIERLRGQWALQVWAKEMAAQGEILDAKKLWPAPSAQMVEFRRSLSNAIQSLPLTIRNYGGQVSCIVPTGSGWSRGSQQPVPVFYSGRASTNTWSDLDNVVAQAEPALAEIRRLLKNVPRGINYDISTNDDEVPDFVPVRVGAQSLQVSAMRNLHKHDLPAAFDDLSTLQTFVTTGDDDPTLVSLLIRIAVLGIAVDVTWDAIKADGWSEDQLAALQQLYEEHRKLLAQMPRAMDAERIWHLRHLEWSQHHTYGEISSRYEPLMESFGINRAEIDRSTGPVWWRQWMFHPLWRFAWADQEKVIYIKDRQKELTAVREAAVHGSYKKLSGELADNEVSYHAPLLSWRFYFRLPFCEDLPGVDWSPLRPGDYPYSSSPRAWSTSLHKLTLNEMALAAIAIKRYELRHGGPPAALADLSPEILKDVPRDLMDGKPLRYRKRSDDTFTLYSVGWNFQDDGGDATPPKAIGNQHIPSPWDCKDCVWP